MEKNPSLSPAGYFPIEADNILITAASAAHIDSEPLDFWLSVERGMRKRSAASVWFQPVRSSISMIMRPRSHP